jgi:predicted phage gp36 major capsid-like protein
MNIFEPDQIALMRAALAEAANDTRPDPATRALMAERILQSAANGARTKEEFRAVATDAVRPKAAYTSSC